MDNTINPEEIANVLKQFDRHKQAEEYDTTSTNSREIVSSIGTDTPITVLLDIRQLITELLTETKVLNEKIDFQQELNEKRHKESLAFMFEMSKSVSRNNITHTPIVSSQPRSSFPTEHAATYYYKGDEIKTSQSVIGCILIHLVNLTSKTLSVSNDVSDVTVMELKDWASAVTILREVDSANTPNSGVLQLPKIGSTESQYALSIIAAPVAGRITILKCEHIAQLVANCSTVVKCVEEIRLRATKCPGIIGSSRLRILSAIEYPYVTNDGVLNIVAHSPRPIGSAVIHEKIKSMNINQKKIYAQLILRNGKKPVVALNEAFQSDTTFKKWKETES